MPNDEGHCKPIKIVIACGNFLALNHMKDFITVFLFFALVYTWYIYVNDKTLKDNRLESKDVTKALMLDYIRHWEKHSPVDSLLAFYIDEVQISELQLGQHCEGQEAIIDILPWARAVPLQKKASGIVVEQLVIGAYTASIQGYLAAHRKGVALYREPIPFFSTIVFDENGKIVKQIWWQKYGH